MKLDNEKRGDKMNIKQNIPSSHLHSASSTSAPKLDTTASFLSDSD